MLQVDGRAARVEEFFEAIHFVFADRSAQADTEGLGDRGFLAGIDRSPAADGFDRRAGFGMDARQGTRSGHSAGGLGGFETASQISVSAHILASVDITR